TTRLLCSRHRPPPHLHSFPTRRSSDLPTAVNRVLQEVRQLQAEGRDLVSLMRGQPDTPTSPHIVEAAIKALRDGHTGNPDNQGRSEEHTSELQSRVELVCRLLREKEKQ